MQPWFWDCHSLHRLGYGTSRLHCLACPGHYRRDTFKSPGAGRRKSIFPSPVIASMLSWSQEPGPIPRIHTFRPRPRPRLSCACCNLRNSTRAH